MLFNFTLRRSFARVNTYRTEVNKLLHMESPLFSTTAEQVDEQQGIAVKTHKNADTFSLENGNKSTLNAVLSKVTVEPRPSKPVPPQLRRDKLQQAAKKKTTPYIPGTVNLQVLGAGANGSPSAIYLFTDQARYLFNCGEGTQRLAHEHKTKLARLEHIFVTRNTWSMVGGFPGLALTIQDAGVKELSLHGPPHLSSILHSMKRFVVLKTLNVNTCDCTHSPDFEDAVMTVKYVPLYKNRPEDKKDASFPIDADNQMVVSYICKLKPRPGALNLVKCVERGVPPGPLLGQLKNGIDVTLPDGTVVLSKDVSEPSETALSFVFLDIPTVDYLPALQAQSEVFQKLQKETESEVALVVHFTPAQILENNCYRDFMENFSPRTQHLYLNSPKNSFSGYVAAHRIQYQLNQLNVKTFPLLAEALQDTCNSTNISSTLKRTKLSESAEVEENAEKKVKSKAAAATTQLMNINSLTNFHLRPRKGLDRSSEAQLTPTEYISETQALPDFPAALTKLKVLQQGLPQTNANVEYPKITFLGTGSCIPNKTRNVSAIMIQPAENSYILLDCGEGTLGQVVRFFGKSQAEHVIRNLKAIYISHLHADHHIGLIGLLNERQRLLQHSEIPLLSEEKVLLLAPVQIQPWLNFYNERIERIEQTYTLVGNAEMLDEPMYLQEARADIGIDAVSTCLVRHCPHSFGVSLTLPAAASGRNEPIKITYSGDSMPCRDLVELGRNSTVLIHEATMEDDLVEEAKIKMHSTISQAISQGREMHAQHIILTHFSQRYAKLPRMQQLMGVEAEQTPEMSNVSIAFDNMQVTLGDLEQFHHMYPALHALFAEHAEELEQKALKREMKLERKRKLLNAD
ncbi:ribonuclease Z, mitochondrial [Ceratitis capitata]|uniref:ribonuclease Z, mitochondrial n=1 Tax=Ceratitis capitata TaxID=7213 RepID=UPI000329D93E|nr:ribonuclease Z, mitochondrial [Ceratitis capitata]XP_020713816.1 ribonuclease Z, mitochondrial [Ceratitis capitata]XP_020713817.1 ribonuclease Z, mitochondrial [Ceratitis capitata]